MTSPRTRFLTLSLALSVALIAAGAGGWALSRWSAHPVAASRPVPLTTTAVMRTDLSTATSLQGSLGYAGSYSVAAQRQGILTALPSPGTVVDRGQTLFEVDGRAIPLFFGERPQWRALNLDVTPGADVVELEANLIALGFASASDLTRDGTFTRATALAVDRWEVAAGRLQDGTVRLGDTAYAPGPLRIETLAAHLGSNVQPGSPLLSATST